MQSFKESIIIPYPMFKKCDFSSGQNKNSDYASKIINETDDELDNKIEKQKEFINKRMFGYKPYTVYSTEMRDITEQKQKQQLLIDEVVHSIKVSERANIRNILNKLISNNITWNNFGELIIKNDVIHSSNIIDIMKYFSGTVKITESKNIPVGAIRLFQIMQNMNIPLTWLKTNPNKTYNKELEIKDRVKGKISKDMNQTSGDSYDDDDEDDYRSASEYSDNENDYYNKTLTNVSPTKEKKSYSTKSLKEISQNSIKKNPMTTPKRIMPKNEIKSEIVTPEMVVKKENPLKRESTPILSTPEKSYRDVLFTPKIDKTNKNKTEDNYETKSKIRMVTPGSSGSKFSIKNKNSKGTPLSSANNPRYVNRFGRQTGWSKPKKYEWDNSHLKK